MPVLSESTLTCRVCGSQKTEAMSTDSCQYFYRCENCDTLLRPQPGDCCVFCSYGTVQCPSKQAEAMGTGASSQDDEA